MSLITTLPGQPGFLGQSCYVSKSTSSFEANFSHMNLGMLQAISLNFRDILILQFTLKKLEIAPNWLTLSISTFRM